MLTTLDFPPSHSLRDCITNAYRMDETECLKKLIPNAKFSENQQITISETAQQLVIGARASYKKGGNIAQLLHQYDLSSEEGIALMCLAEALLRIPDNETINKLISDKISAVDWQTHLHSSNSFFVNAATWSLVITGKIFSPARHPEKKLRNSLKSLVSRLGGAMIRPLVFQMMKLISKQFLIGQEIQSALNNSVELEKLGYFFSYDMLGEEARTARASDQYFHAYMNAIEAIAHNSHARERNPGISIKLSALHPRYSYTQRERILQELPEKLFALTKQAMDHNINVTIDAEETERLDLSLDLFENLFRNPLFANWQGLGLAVQAYQKRAFYILDWLAHLAREEKKIMRVRLVKGAYWDAEIKTTQVQGFAGYPVFTRKNSTDVSYIACAKKLLDHSDCFYPEFGTHNAYSVAAILELVKIKYGDQKDLTPIFEFQCLYGMGRPLYDQLLQNKNFNIHCRMYAPVGSNEDLLGYLVRRLLENGANTSFINQVADEKLPIESLLIDPVARIESLTVKPHPKIPSPAHIYVDWLNSQSPDLSDKNELRKLKEEMEKSNQKTWQASSIINGHSDGAHASHQVRSPSTLEVIGTINTATEKEIEDALRFSTGSAKKWEATPYTFRAEILENAANLFQKEMPRLMTLLALEGGRCILDCVSEVRETIDYCRYYAYRARCDLKTMELPGPTGEANQLGLHPRGVIACISPWNFPLAIFAGQICAALVTGNPVIAKPAEQTPLIAHEAIQIFHRAGIPTDVLQLLIGAGETGAKLVADERISGVMFTGSTETAKMIQRALADRSGPIIPFVAETGGQNAMIIDSSTLIEQSVIDIAQSAFNSAGQRCSALRLLFVQADIAPKLIDMLKGYMHELNVGNPTLLASDIGPVIDLDALNMLKKHFFRMEQEAKLIAQTPFSSELPGYFFAPCAFELKDSSVLKREVFGPILHIIRYSSHALNKVMDAIIETGYGLTLGIESRIDATIKTISERMPVGNIYVNRNMIGAVVGVQPFGGERLSGTGPKAGGPHYLTRLCVERSISLNTVAMGGNARLVTLLEED